MSDFNLSEEYEQRDSEVDDLQPLEVESLADRVYERILTQIIRGRIKYGESLNIKRLAQQFRVSTMPVRQALARLEYESIVTIKPRSGCEVRVPTARKIREIYELRELYELHAVRKAIRSEPKPDLRELRRIVEQMKATCREPDTDARHEKMIELDRRFHEEIVRLSGSEFLMTQHRILMLHVNINLVHERQRGVLDDKEYVESHEAIVERLEESDPRVDQAVRRHFKFVEDTVLDMD